MKSKKYLFLLNEGGSIGPYTSTSTSWRSLVAREATTLAKPFLACFPRSHTSHNWLGLLITSILFTILFLPNF